MSTDIFRILDASFMLAVSTERLLFLTLLPSSTSWKDNDKVNIIDSIYWKIYLK